MIALKSKSNICALFVVLAFTLVSSPLTQAQVICSSTPVDIVWLLDESGSVGAPNYAILKDFVIQTAQILRIINNNTCNGAVEFGGRSNRQPRTNRNVAIPVKCDGTFDTAVNNLVFDTKEWTYTRSAMDFMANTYFPANPKSGSVPRQRIFIVATDGYPRGKGDADPPNSQSRGLVDATERAVVAGDVDRLIYLAIGKTKIDLTMFDGVSVFDPSTDLIAVDDFSDLVDVIINITTSTCFSPRPTTNPTTAPSPRPTSSPSPRPTNASSDSPTSSPTTVQPSRSPTHKPTDRPTTPQPSRSPTTATPTRRPSVSPTTATPTNAPTRGPTDSPSKRPTTGPTKSPTPGVYTDCPGADIFYATDHSNSITTPEGQRQRDLMQFFIDRIRIGTNAQRGARFAFGDFANGYRMEMQASTSAPAVRASVQKYINTWKEGRRRWTRFEAVLNYVHRNMHKSPTSEYPRKYVIISSDGEPYLRFIKPHGGKRAIEHQCKAFRKYKLRFGTQAAKFLCFQSNGRLTPNPFYDCACDKVWTFQSYGSARISEIAQEIVDDNICG